ncbi:hypothetical protein CDAR_445911 [Caerostris darwini]|uniref:Galectin n=1 Tax=Caerostris darwini TaxID=1538125 RepID=A0AAV4U0J3_9ARAC|nr:hypothetical protein CDAR_445911 [Caerostris darwini]
MKNYPTHFRDNAFPFKIPTNLNYERETCILCNPKPFHASYLFLPEGFPFNFGGAIIHLNSSSCTTQITSRLHCHIPDQYSELQMTQLLLDKPPASVQIVIQGLDVLLSKRWLDNGHERSFKTPG